jgi:hypothetical protein
MIRWGLRHVQFGQRPLQRIGNQHANAANPLKYWIERTSSRGVSIRTAGRRNLHHNGTPSASKRGWTTTLQMLSRILVSPNGGRIDALGRGYVTKIGLCGLPRVAGFDDAPFSHGWGP